MSAQPGTTYGTRFRFEGTDCTIYSGSGSPEGSQVGSVGDLYVQTDAGAGETAVWHKATGTATNTGWEAVGASGSGAPDDATYLIQTADGDLANAQAMGALATGLVKNTTTTGVQTIAEPDVDYLAPTSTVGGSSVTTHLRGVTDLTDLTSPPSPTNILRIALADGDCIGGEFAFVVRATDASDDNDVYTGSVRFAVQRKGAVVTASIDDIGVGLATKSHGGADLTVVASCEAPTEDGVWLQLQADTVLTATTLTASWVLMMLSGHGAISFPTALPEIEVLVVGGGGGGGAEMGGGGGAGAVVYDAAYPVDVGTYAVVVGDGGAGDTDASGTGTAGEESSFDGAVIAAGGGGGGSRDGAPNYAGNDGGDGASGGGASHSNTSTRSYGGTGSAGNDGGDAATEANYGSGGGGGAGTAGQDVTGSTGGNGGDGTDAYSDLLIDAGAGVDVGGVHWIAGGGGGATYSANTPGTGGKGGGGNGRSSDGNAYAATANTGSGGGGGSYGYDGGAGGSGIVIIRYPTGSLTATGGSTSTANGYTYHVFTADGTFEVTG